MSALLDLTPSHTFTLLEGATANIRTLVSRKEQLMQYNLDKNLQISRFRFSGTLSRDSAADYEELLKELFTSATVLSVVGMPGTPAVPVEIASESLSLSVMSMEFFDRLETAGIQ